MTQSNTHPFSAEKPVFELEKHIVQEHDETDVYGIDHQLSYRSKSADSIYDLSLGLVGFRLGGTLYGADEEGIKVRFNASIHFPTIRQAQLKGNFITDVEPQHEELEIIASGLMAILAHKKV